jgi:hypothetical protein
MVLTDFKVDGSSVTSSKVTSFSVISSFSPIQSGEVGPSIFGIRTGEPFASKMRGPAARKTLACSRGWTRIFWTCSAVSSAAVVVETAMVVSWSASHDSQGHQGHTRSIAVQSTILNGTRPEVCSQDTASMIICTRVPMGAETTKFPARWPGASVWVYSPPPPARKPV